MKRRVCLVLSLLFFVFIPFWLVVFGDFTAMSKELSGLNLRQSGETRVFDRDNETWSVLKVSIGMEDSLFDQRDHVLVESKFIGYDTEGLPEFDASSSYAVEPVSRANLPGIVEKDRVGLFEFPPFVKKKSYLMHSPLVVEEAANVYFVEEEKFRGESLYKFAFNINDVDKSVFFPSFSFGENEIMRGSHNGEILVEPVSGEVVYFSHRGRNEVVNIESNVVVSPHEDWFNVTTVDSGQSNLVRALSRKSTLLSLLLVPTILAGFFGVFFLLIYLFWERLGNYFSKANKVALACAVVTCLVSFFVMLGWFFGLEQFKSILPGLVSMKFTTSVGFILSAFILYFLSLKHSGSAAETWVLISAFVVLLLMGTTFVTSVLGIPLGLESLFPSDSSASLTVGSGRPSYGTILCFLLIVVIALLEVMGDELLVKAKQYLSFGVLAVASVALFGYLFDFPVLYYYVDSVSTAMALHTALLFIILSVGFTYLFNDKR